MVRKPWNKHEQWVPFTHKTGNQMHYPENHSDGGVWDNTEFKWTVQPVYGEPVWRKNEVFADTLIYRGHARGRSAAYFEFDRESIGTSVIVFMADFDEMVPFMTKGRVSGKFTFCKRGMNYGCIRVGD